MKKTKAKKSPQFVLLPDKKSPLVHLDFAIRHGSLNDPEGKDGVASMTLSMLLRGTKNRDAAAFHRDLDNLGGEIHLGKYKESLRIYGVVLAKKLDKFLDLLEDMLVHPKFAPEEFQKVRAQIESSLHEELGNDDEIADRRFQEYLLWGNPYGKLTSGSLESIGKIQIQDLEAFYDRFFRAEDILVGATGGFESAKLKKRLQSILKKLPQKSQDKHEAAAPVFEAGRRLLVLDKADRTQSQVTLGSPGVAYNDKDYIALALANHVFGGGSFSARLMKEVREKRGWSYGAYAWFRSGKKPLYFAMSCNPANKDTIPAVQLMIKLFSDFSKKGITKTEFDFAKKSLVNQSAFLQDTLTKRLDNKISEILLGLPEGFYDGYRKKVAAITFSQVQKAIKKHFDPTRIFALVLGSSKEIESAILSLKGFKKFWVVPFDQSPKSLEEIPSKNFNGAKKPA